MLSVDNRPYLSSIRYGFFISILMYLCLQHADAGEPLQLKEVVTTATADTTDRLAVNTAFGAVIDLSESGPSALSLSDILENRAGVHTRTFGGLGDFSTVSLRGSSPRHVSVQIDNTPLNRARGGVVNLADIPAGIIESIEIYKGAVPPGLSGDSPGGVTRINTRRFKDRPSINVHGSFGSFKTARTGFTYGDSLAGIDMILSSDFQRTDGDFKFPDDNGTPFKIGRASCRERVCHRV